jgi:hypothetical protein
MGGGVFVGVGVSVGVRVGVGLGVKVAVKVGVGKGVDDSIGVLERVARGEVTTTKGGTLAEPLMAKATACSVGVAVT